MSPLTIGRGHPFRELNKMRKQVFLCLGLIVAAMSVSNPVLAWGQKGHRLTGILARDLLTDEARANLKAIMDSDDLGSFTLHMDKQKMRLAETIPGSREWHYDDKPVCEPDVPKSEYCKDGNCASTQITRHYKILLDDHSTKPEKQFAIFVLSHLIGDIHQPLHAADNDDRGGNSVKVKLPGSNAKKKNLHSAWDTDFVERLYKGKDERAVARQLLQDHKEMIPTWRKGREGAWIEESHQIAKDVVYGKLSGFACGAELGEERVELTDEYAEEANRIIPEQLVKAGVRMARLLNRALAD